jgi:hypothetical protein
MYADSLEMAEVQISDETVFGTAGKQNFLSKLN